MNRVDLTGPLPALPDVFDRIARSSEVTRDSVRRRSPGAVRFERSLTDWRLASQPRLPKPKFTISPWNHWPIYPMRHPALHDHTYAVHHQHLIRHATARSPPLHFCIRQGTQECCASSQPTSNGSGRLHEEAAHCRDGAQLVYSNGGARGYSNTVVIEHQ